MNDCSVTKATLTGTQFGKALLLQVLQNILEPTEQNRGHLVVIAELFDHLNDVYRSYLEVEMQSQVRPIYLVWNMFRK
jgi:hypothetical protein